MTRKLTPRQVRVLELLKPGGWVMRETIDREAGASNGPDVVRQLRYRFGHDAIESQRVSTVDRDGKRCEPGRYRLTDIGRERLQGVAA